MMLRTLPLCALTLIVSLLLQPPVGAQPDPRQMSGVPLPVTDVAPGTVTVRVLRGGFSNPVASQTVEITGPSTSLRAVTNDTGRAEFTKVPTGVRLKASATVAGERLESQEFVVPDSGGIRLMLVAGEAAGDSAASGSDPETATAPAAPGSVVLGQESRFIFEMGEDGLTVFYVLQVMNSGPGPVQPDAPLVLDLPEDARGAAVLEGSSPQASVSGRQLQIVGPFQPGPTIVQVGYTLPFSSANLVVEQRLPVRLEHVAVVAQKVGDMEMTSPQVAEQRTMPAQGNLYIAGRGGPVEAGTVMRFSFTGMPHEPVWPRNLALALAVVILAAGIWFAVRPGADAAGAAAERRSLEARRERLFDELTALETQHREGRVDGDRYAERRRELVVALERVYAALDAEPAASRAS